MTCLGNLEETSERDGGMQERVRDMIETGEGWDDVRDDNSHDRKSFTAGYDCISRTWYGVHIVLYVRKNQPHSSSRILMRRACVR